MWLELVYERGWKQTMKLDTQDHDVAAGECPSQKTAEITAVIHLNVMEKGIQHSNTDTDRDF